MVENTIPWYISAYFLFLGVCGLACVYLIWRERNRNWMDYEWMEGGDGSDEVL